MSKKKLSMKKMRRSYDKNSKGGNFFQVKEGDTICYIHPPCRPDDKFEPTAGTNYIAAAVHYGVGKNNNMVVCLDEANNDWISHPFIKKLLKKNRIKLNGKCPVCKEIESGRMSDDEADSARVGTRYLWGLTPLMQRDKPSSKWQKLDPKPQPALLSKTLYDGIMDLFFEEDDITDPNAAILIRINRKGTGMTDTRYKVTAYTPTLKKPKKLSKAMKILLEASMKDGGSCDLFTVIAAMMRDPAAVKAILAGVPVEELDDEDNDEEDDSEATGEDHDDEDDDDEDDDDDSDDEDDDDEDDDDEDDDDEDDDDDDDDDEDDDDEDDEDDDDEDGDDEDDDDDDDDDDDEEDDDDEDEEEEKPKSKSKAKSKSKTKAKSKTKTKTKGKKSKKEDDDDDDLGLDELEKEIEGITKKKSKKSSAKSKSKTKEKSKSKTKEKTKTKEKSKDKGKKKSKTKKKK